MANDKEYNGWSNYETWNVKLWIDNDQGSYEYWREVVQDEWKDNARDKDDTIYAVSKRLEQEIDDDGKPELQGCYSDLLSAALSEVNWYEIAEAMVNDEDLVADADEDAEVEAEAESE